MAQALVIDLVRHMKARNREKWGEHDDARPLTKLGLRQAKMHAAAMAKGEPVVAVYSSPAMRCRQTIEPVAERFGLAVNVEALLAETRLLSSLPIGAENPLLARLRDTHPDGGRIVACSHADTIPAFIAALEMQPPPAMPAVLKGFGGWFRVCVADNRVGIERIEAPRGFPQG